MAKKKTKKRGKLAAALTTLEVPMMADFYSDMGLAAQFADKLQSLGLYNEGGKIKSNKQLKSKSPRGCGVALRGYGKAAKK